MAGVTLSAGVRSNLLSLQGTADLKELVQGRLATGKKVNSALDNPNSFFTASALSNRANDLSNLLDAIGQGVQTLKAADQGISAITKLVESAKAKLNQSLATSDNASRLNYRQEYNELLRQARDVARDSGYNGKNLLGGSGNDLKIAFNETNTSSLSISAVDFASAGALGLQDLGVGTAPTTITISLAGVVDANTLMSNVTVNGKDFDVGDQIQVNGSTTVVASNSTLGDYMIDLTNGGLSVTLTDPTTLTITNPTGAPIVVGDDTATAGTIVTNFTVAAAGPAGPSTATLEAEIEKVNAALTTLRDQASTFGTNLQVVQNRQDFTKSFINVLQVGADKLVLADTNEEGANLLALNTRQQLSTTALSFASQADQAVLQFLR